MDELGWTLSVAPKSSNNNGFLNIYYSYAVTLRENHT